MTDPLLTTAARRHIGHFLKAIAPQADRLDRRYRSALKGRSADVIRALIAITPGAASRLQSLPRFFEQVEYNGRRLAKLNIQPDDARAVLKSFGGLVEQVIPDRFEPAREQLNLATVFALNQAYYQVREAEAQAFFGLYRAELEADGLDDLMLRFVRVLTRAFRATAGRILLLDRPITGKLKRAVYIGQNASELVLDPEMRGRFRSYWSFPMAPTAVLQLGFPTSYPWLPREVTLLDAVAERCLEAIQKAQLHVDLRRLEAQAHQAEEQERRRIGRELHDEAGQSLLLLRLQLELMERQADADLRPRLAEARAIAERTVEELRRIVAALSPAVLERLGLEAAIRHLVARFNQMHPAQIRLRLSGSLRDHSRQSEEVIYRVAQESLQNIAKHSQATHVNLLLQSTDKKLRLSVSDNGAGFADKTASSKPMSFGLTGMRERAALLHGTLVVHTAPGKGVRVVLELPHSSPG